MGRALMGRLIVVSPVNTGFSITTKLKCIPINITINNNAI